MRLLLLGFSLLIASCQRDPEPAAPSTSPAPPVVPQPPAKVVLFVEKSPPGTDVVDYRTGQVLGSVPGSVEVPRGYEPIELHFVHRDFIGEKRIVTPDRDLSLSVPMRPRPPHLYLNPPPPDQR